MSPAPADHLRTDAAQLVVQIWTHKTVVISGQLAWFLTPRERLLTWAESANLGNRSTWWSRLLDHGEVAVLLLDHCNLVGAEGDHLAATWQAFSPSSRNN